jgi:hypothetical protein
MSKYMLSDKNTLNDINPFVLSDFSLPGGWSEPQPYVDDTIDSKVYIASEGIVAGDRTIDSVMAIKPNCRMSRPLEPVRSYDSDILKGVSSISDMYEAASGSLSENGKKPDMLLYIALAIVVVLLFTSK